MPQSLSRIFLHITFSTKNRVPLITPSVAQPLYAYVAGILHNIECHAVRIGGIADHVHILCTLSRTLSVADLIENVKKDSSKWIKREGAAHKDFQWQRGYGAFSVSQSNVPRLIAYIDGQETHHKKISFEDEFRALCRKHKIDIDERFVWD